RLIIHSVDVTRKVSHVGYLLNLECVEPADVVINDYFFFFSSRRRHTRSVSAFLLNRSSDLRIFLMSSLMLLLVWLIFFMVLIKLLPILGTISGKTVKLMVLALICLGNNRQD